MTQMINGFSKLSKKEKIKWLTSDQNINEQELNNIFSRFESLDSDEQNKLDKLSENTIANFALPFGIAPNFLINGRHYTVPMVIEESSVVGAASASAKFWHSRGGFKAEIISTRKVGHVHFYWEGEPQKLSSFFSTVSSELIKSTEDITINMKKRGGGLKSLELKNETSVEENYYQLEAHFETCDAMGANFINTVLERLGSEWKERIESNKDFELKERELEVVMCILSNYTPECIVRCSVECPIEELGDFPNGLSSHDFARKFKRAVNISHVSPYRAVTHNKGILNGIDSVVLATGNDFRAVEACLHAYASKDGQYKGLTHCEIENDKFRFFIDAPLSLGTVGGITSIHPMAQTALKILGHPTAPELMMIVAATGLAQNFGALRALVTTGIQKGHMKMHLMNILNQLGATQKEKSLAEKYFENEVISFRNVSYFLEQQKEKLLN